MKLKDAIFKMEPGDKFHAPALDELSPYTMMDDGSIVSKIVTRGVILTPSNLNIEGVIIKAEPKVLSAEVIGRNMFNNNRQDFRTTKSFAISCVDARNPARFLY